MQSHDESPEILAVQQQLNIATASFDAAIKKDIPLKELKKLFHEMKTLKERLNSLNESKMNKNRHA